MTSDDDLCGAHCEGLRKTVEPVCDGDLRSMRAMACNRDQRGDLLMPPLMSPQEMWSMADELLRRRDNDA
jgi:hypothetical protein